jgi:NADH-quinone oxidoreductase subunit E
VGADRLRDALQSQLGVVLGGTTADNRFTLLPIVCLGACDRAPAMMVDDDLHGPVWPEDVAGILARYP